MISAKRRKYLREVIKAADKQDELPELAYPGINDLGGSLMLSSLNTNTDIKVINAMGTGSGNQYRRGNKVNTHSVRVWGQMIHTVKEDAITGSIDGNSARMVLVWDKQPNGVTPAFNEIFGLLEGTTGMLAPVIPSKTNRFTILRDKRWAMNPKLGGPEQHKSIYLFDETVDLQGRESQYTASGPGLISTMSSGALFMVWRALYEEVDNFVTLSPNSQTMLHFYP